ncbi:hypothetical protein ABZ904_50660 [Streptomyces sp. NPDC046900]|uniref:hypothetical protein n=1 Tax=Streptomyces sp. NPDC046900 TaxID=3155473 RepID=UPI0033EE11E3
MSSLDAFAEAGNLYGDQLRRDGIKTPAPVDLMHRRVMEITGADLLPCGTADRIPALTG